MTNPGKRIQREIREMLMEHWDPININDVPEAADEYDSYIGKVYKLLVTKATEEEIADYLDQVEAVEMGLGSTKRRGQLLEVARRLRSVDVTLP